VRGDPFSSRPFKLVTTISGETEIGDEDSEELLSGASPIVSLTPEKSRNLAAEEDVTDFA
jgi:hypothetical protein